MTCPAGTDGSQPDAPRSILRNFRSVVVGRLFSALSIWLALIALTKMSDPITVGIYALAQVICIPLAEIAKLSLREIRSSDAPGMVPFGDYLALRMVAACTAIVLMIGIGMVLGGSATIQAVIAIYALARGAELISDMIYGLFQAHERMDHIGRSLCILGPLSLSMLVAGYWMTGSLLVAVLGQLLAHLLVLFLHDLPLARHQAELRTDLFAPRWAPWALRRLTLRAIPLTFATLLLIFALYLPRFAIEHLLGLGALGLFAAILAMAMAPDRLVNAIGVAASIRLATGFAEGRHGEFVALLAILVGAVASLGALGVAICAIAGETILRFVYTESYAAHHDLLVWLVAAAALRGVANVLRYGVIATRRFWWIGTQNSAAAIAAILGCATLLPAMGLAGAGATMVLVFAVQLIVAALSIVLTLHQAKYRSAST